MAFVLTFPLYCDGEVLYKTIDGIYNRVGGDCIIVPMDTIPYEKQKEFYKELTELVIRISGIRL